MGHTDKKVQIREEGAICIGGKGVAFGYVNDDTLTRNAFVYQDGLSRAKIYHKGDLGYLNENGNSFLGDERTIR